MVDRVMAYINRLRFGDSPNLDAFGRLRTSDPFTQFDWKNTFSPSTFANQQFWDVAVVGSGTASPVANQSAVRLSTGGTTDTHAATIHTKQQFIYQPGKSRRILQTFVMSAAVTDATAEIGYGDANDGIFLQRADSTVNLIRRTSTSGSPVETTVAQSSWDDPMDGTGASGKTLDLTKTQILAIDLEWLGVGRVRVSFIIDGVEYVVHEFKYANSISLVYMKTGSLPVRAQVINTATASGTLTMDVICTSVVSEGGYEVGNYPQFYASTGTSALSTSTTLLPLISIRCATSFNSETFRGHIIPKVFGALVASNIHEYQIIKNAALTSASFTAANSTYSAAEYDVSASAISGGIVMDGGYIPAAGNQRNSDDAELFSKLPIVYTSLNNTQETITIAVRTVTGTGSAYGNISWQEEY